MVNAAHQIVRTGNLRRQIDRVLGTVPVRIIIPGDYIQHILEFVVIQIFVKTHQVGGGGKLRPAFPHRLDLLLAEIYGLMGDEPFPVQAQAVAMALASGKRRLDLAPVSVGMAPKAGPPGMV